MFPATVGAFKLDRFEVTIGRFRRFVAAYPSSKPAVGSGEHPRIRGTGWNPDWDQYLPVDNVTLRNSLMCKGFGSFDPPDPEKVLWTDEPGQHEDSPVGCVSWALGFAFCAWDGGRLPTETEWEYAVVGGDEQRPFPWGDAPADEVHAVLVTTANGYLRPAGSVPGGRARWGQFDLNGSRYEFVFDAARKSRFSYPLPCVDCVAPDDAFDVTIRGLRDISFYQGGTTPTVQIYDANVPSRLEIPYGIRCARD